MINSQIDYTIFVKVTFLRLIEVGLVVHWSITMEGQNVFGQLKWNGGVPEG